MVETLTFLVAAVIVLGGAVGVIISRNAVHAALSLVATLFGVAVLFVAQEAHLLAAVQVIVYTGAIVVLILFVLMLLGIDRVEDLGTERLGGQRALGALLGAGLLAAAGVVAWRWIDDGDNEKTNLLTGMPGATARLDDRQSDIEQIGRVLFTDYVLAFELTAALLTIAVIGAVVLARRVDDPADLPEHPDETAAADVEAAVAGESSEEVTG